MRNMLTTALMALAATAAASSALARDPVPSVALPDSAQICTPEGGFGVAWSSTPPDRPERGWMMIGPMLFRPLAGYGPLREARIQYLEDGSGVVSVTAVLPEDSGADPRAIASALRARFEASHLFAAQPTVSDDDASFHADIPGDLLGYRLDISVFGGSLQVTCTLMRHQRLFQVARMNLMGLQPEPMPAPARETPWDPAAVARQACTTAGGFGLRFGGPLRQAAQVIEPQMKSLVPTTEAAGPFPNLIVSLTRRTGRIHGIRATALFGTVHEAARAYADLVAAFEQVDALPRQTRDLLIAGPVGRVFSTDEAAARDISAFVGLRGREVVISCADNDLLSEAFDEAFE